MKQNDRQHYNCPYTLVPVCDDMNMAPSGEDSTNDEPKRKSRSKSPRRRLTEETVKSRSKSPMRAFFGLDDTSVKSIDKSRSDDRKKNRRRLSGSKLSGLETDPTVGPKAKRSMNRSSSFDAATKMKVASGRDAIAIAKSYTAASRRQMGNVQPSPSIIGSKPSKQYQGNGNFRK